MENCNLYLKLLGNRDFSRISNNPDAWSLIKAATWEDSQIYFVEEIKQPKQDTCTSRLIL